MLATRGVHITSQPLAGDHQLLVERVVRVVRSGLRMHVPGGWRLHLNLYQRAIFSEYWKGAVKILKIFLFGHGQQVTHHEVRSVICVAACSIALNRAGQVESQFFQEAIFEIESGLIYVFVGLRQDRAQNGRRDARVQILADLERNLHFFFQWRRDMLGHKVFCFVIHGQGFEVRRICGSRIRASNSLSFQRFQERDRSETFRLGNAIGGHACGAAERQRSGDGGDMRAIGIGFIGVVKGGRRSRFSGGGLIHKGYVAGLRRTLDRHWSAFAGAGRSDDINQIVVDHYR